MILARELKKFQEGGPMPAPEAGAPMEGAPMGPEAGPEAGAPAAGPSPEEVMQLAQQFIQQFGPDVAAMLADAIMQVLQGGGAAAGPEGPMAPPAPEQQPVFRRGGKMLYRVR